MTTSADFDLYGKLRPAKNVQPGWYLRTDDGWFEVSIYMHTEDMFTRQKAAKFLFTDGTTMAVVKSADVMCRTAAEARKAAKAEALNAGDAR